MNAIGRSSVAAELDNGGESPLHGTGRPHADRHVREAFEKKA